MARPYGIKENITLDTSGISYAGVLDYPRFDNAIQLEVKVDVIAGDGVLVFSLETSDDGVKRFEVENSSFTINAIDDGGIIIDVHGNYARAKIAYSHATLDTEFNIFTLVR